MGERQRCLGDHTGVPSRPATAGCVAGLTPHEVVGVFPRLLGMCLCLLGCSGGHMWEDILEEELHLALESMREAEQLETLGLLTNGVSFLQTNNTIVLTDLIVMVMPFLQAGRKRETLPCTEEPMITLGFITALFYHVDEQLRTMPKHPEAHLWPSELVTLGLLHALKGVGNRAFYRWLTRDYRPLFPRLPERTRLFRLFRTHQDWTQAFLATP